MIGISKLYCGTVEPSDVLRYGRRTKDLPSHLLQFSEDKRPVVVWNITRRCNLHCLHCYSHSRNVDFADELSGDEGRALMDDLADFGVPVILFSGGEPLMHPEILDRIAYARSRGMRAVLSTNGTLMTSDIVQSLKAVGISYVGVSLDGLQETHDRFRCVPGAFDKAMDAVRMCRDAGVKVGLRFTINRRNAHDVHGVFDLIRQERVPRICFYHLAYSGRGDQMAGDDLSHEQTRAIMDLIMDQTKALHREGMPTEVLTVDNHCDGPYLYLRLMRENPAQARRALELLQMNGGNSSGLGIGCVSWDGTVYADQFWRSRALGHVKDQPFSRIWSDADHPWLSKLRSRKVHLNARCAQCRWLNVCNGNLRARAESVSGDPWAWDPACYLTDDETRSVTEVV